MSLTNAQTDVVLEALEAGATVAEAAALAKLDMSELEEAWLTSRLARTKAGRRLYVEGRAAIARWRVSLRGKAGPPPTRAEGPPLSSCVVRGVGHRARRREPSLSARYRPPRSRPGAPRYLQASRGGSRGTRGGSDLRGSQPAARFARHC